MATSPVAAVGVVVTVEDNVMKRIVLYVLPLVLFFASCDGAVYYAEYAEVDENGWNPADSACFDVEVKDTNTVFDFLVEVRNSVDYAYSNTFFFINTTFPDGSVARDTMECPLADPMGAWLGKSSGRYVDSRYYFRRNARFPMTGNYHFAITNGMRDSAVCGLEHIGFRVEYSKKD